MAKTRSNFVVQSLLRLFETSITVSAASRMSDLVHLLEQTHPERSFSVNAVGQSVRRLEKRRLIALTKRGSEIELFLTDAGHQFIQKPVLADTVLPPNPVSWDGQWHIVLFSIPESKKEVRTIFRRKLQSLGFVLLHRSAWVYPYPCEIVVAELVRRLELNDSVTIITTNTLVPDEHFLQHFGLNSALSSTEADHQTVQVYDELIPMVELE